MACCAANPPGSYCNNWCPNTCVQQGKNGAPLYYDSNGNPVYAAATFGGPIGSTAAASSPGATGPGQQASGPGSGNASWIYNELLKVPILGELLTLVDGWNKGVQTIQKVITWVQKTLGLTADQAAGTIAIIEVAGVLSLAVFFLKHAI